MKKKILRHYLHADYVTRQKSLAFYYFNLSVVAGLTLGLLYYIFWLPERLFLAGPPMGAGILLAAFNLFLVYHGRYRAATLLLVSVSAIILFAGQAKKLDGDHHTAYNSFAFIFTLPILIAGLFNQKRFILPVSIIMFFGNAVFYFLLLRVAVGKDLVSAGIGFVSCAIILCVTAAFVFLLRRIMDTALEHVIETNRSMSRFVPFEFLDYLGKKSVSELNLGDNTELEMTVLFCDIRSFTTFTEQVGHNQTFAMLNGYLGTIGPVIRENGGFIDKYIGDAIMALFPKADDAIKAALAMVVSLEEFNRKNGSDIRFGIGIASGLVTLGAIGERQRIENTVISDVVNTAARLESLTKKCQDTVLIAESTVFLTSEPFRKLGTAQVRGKAKKVGIYTFAADQKG